MRIDIQISSAGGAAAAADVGVLTAALRELALAEQAAGRNVTASVSASGMGAPGGLPSGNVAAFQAQQAAGVSTQAAAAAQMGNATRQVSQHTNAATASMRDFTSSTERAHRKVQELRAEMETFNRVRNAPEAQRGAVAMGATGNRWEEAQMLIRRVHDPVHVQQMQDKLDAAEEDLQRRLDRGVTFQARLAQRSVRQEERRRSMQGRAQAGEYETQLGHEIGTRQNLENAEWEAIKRRERRQLQQQSEDEANAALNRRMTMQRTRTMEEVVEQAHLQGNTLATRMQAARVRPGEEMDAARFRAEREAEQRAVREERRLASQQRSEMFDTRRSSMDRFFVGGMMMGAGGGILGGLGAAGMQFGQRQMARIGLEATEGPNADAVMQQARTDAKEIFGASYRDIINFRNQLRQSGETSEATRSMVQGLSDVNAAMGGTNDSMARLIHNLSQVENQGHLTGRDLRDFATNLIPMQQFLARLKGVSPGQISDMVSKKEISAADVRAAIQLMEADPRFHERGRMITENTLPGQMEKLNENFQQLAETAGQVTAPALQGLINTGNRFISFLQGHPGATAAGVYGAGALGLGLGVYGAANVAQGALGMAGRIMPDRVMESKIGSFLFGGGGLERAGRVQMTAAEMQLRAAQMQLGKGGLGGGAAGALPAGEALAAEEGAAGAASGGIMARLGLTPLTPLRAGVGLGLGALGGYNAYSDSGSAALSTFVGVGEAATAMFVPGGAVAVAMVEGIHLLFNHVEGKIENAPENRDPENKTPSDPKLKGMTDAQKMKYYLEEADKHTARAEAIHRRVGDKANKPGGEPGDEEQSEIIDAQIAVQTAAYWRRHMRREVSHAAIARRDKEFEEFAEAHGASTSRVQNPAMVTNKRAEVLRHKDNGKAGREVLLLLPPSNLESDFLDATGG